MTFLSPVETFYVPQFYVGVSIVKETYCSFTQLPRITRGQVAHLDESDSVTNGPKPHLVPIVLVPSLH